MLVDTLILLKFLPACNLGPGPVLLTILSTRTVHFEFHHFLVRITFGFHLPSCLIYMHASYDLSKVDCQLTVEETEVEPIILHHQLAILISVVWGCLGSVTSSKSPPPQS